MLNTLHPIKRAVMVMRCWLLFLSGLMFWNAWVATGYLFSPTVKPVPFVLLALLALIWFTNTWSSSAVIITGVLIVVGLAMRGVEVVFFADAFSWKQRFTGASLWWFASATTFAFCILNLIATGRKEAEEWMEHRQSASSS